MDPQSQTMELLKSSGAVLVSAKNHLKYRLPNGMSFVMATTPSDYRAAQNILHDLKNALGIREEKLATPPIVAVGKPTPIAVKGQEIAAEPTQPPPSIKDRIAVLLQHEKELRDKLTLRVLSSEQRTKVLQVMMDIDDEAVLERVLVGIVGRPRPAAVEEPKTPPKSEEPPQHITRTVQVTRELVRATINGLFADRPFTINDVRDAMVNGAELDKVEAIKVRNSIGSHVQTLYERGEIVKKQEGTGRKQIVWELATGQTGERVEVS